MEFWGIPEEVGGKLEFFQGYHHFPATSAHTLPKAKGAGGSRPLGSQVSSNGTKMEAPACLCLTLTSSSHLCPTSCLPLPSLV